MGIWSDSSIPIRTMDGATPSAIEDLTASEIYKSFIRLQFPGKISAPGPCRTQPAAEARNIPGEVAPGGGERLPHLRLQTALRPLRGFGASEKFRARALVPTPETFSPLFL